MVVLVRTKCQGGGALAGSRNDQRLPAHNTQNQPAGECKIGLGFGTLPLKAVFKTSAVLSTSSEVSARGSLKGSTDFPAAERSAQTALQNPRMTADLAGS